MFGFLSGLHKDLDAVRGRVLSIKPLPTINCAFSEIRQEESRLKVMMGPIVTATESSALLTKESEKNSDTGLMVRKSESKSGNYTKKYCRYCQRNGHQIEECYRRPGSTVQPPPGFVRRNSQRSGNYGSRSNSNGSWRTNAESWKAPSAALAVSEPGSGAAVFTQAHLHAMLKIMDSQRSHASCENTREGDHIRATMASTGNMGKSQLWIVDSGATNHMTFNKSLLSNFQSFIDPRKVRIANGDSISILGCGSVRISSKLMLKHVLYVPTLDCNLVSVRQLMLDNNCWTVFSPTQCFFLPSSSSCFQEKAGKEKTTRETIGSANHRDGLYFLDSIRSGSSAAYSSVYSAMDRTDVPRIDKSRIGLLLLWHRRLGHPNFLYLKKLKPDLFHDIPVDVLKCETCLYGRQARAQYPSKSYAESKPFNLIHSDIWGPSRVLNVNGDRWFVIFVDDHTRVTWIYLMKHKSDLLHIFKAFLSLIQNQFNTSIKNLRSDNGSEYMDKEMRKLLLEKGIHHQTSNVYTPQQNGIAERKHRHILSVARSLMFSMDVPKYLWGEAVLTATYLINRMPSRVLGFTSPRQKLLNVFPHCLLLSELPLKTFGCVAYVYLQAQFRGKLDKRAVKCVFLGYSGSQKGYK